ncbi:transcriptional regulator, partial [Staphylococcus cohnii]
KGYVKHRSIATCGSCCSYDITVGTINALDVNRHQPVIYAYENIPQIKKIEKPVHAIGVPTTTIAEKVVAVLNEVITNETTVDTVYNLEPQITSHN